VRTKGKLTEAVSGVKKLGSEQVKHHPVANIALVR